MTGDLLHGILGIVFARRYRDKLERELAEYFGVRHVFLVSSGKAALALILTALRSLSGRPDVVVPAYTCFSVPSAVVKAGLRVRPCDVDPQTGDFNRRELRGAITGDTLCVVPTHLFGIPADVEHVRQLCRDRGVFVVEDAAQAMGVRHNGRLLGTGGDVGFFSLGRGKNITCGSGGIIVTDSSLLGAALAREHGQLARPGLVEEAGNAALLVAMRILSHPRLYWLPAGIPGLGLGKTRFYRDFALERLSGFKAGVLWRWQERLDAANRGRLESANELRRAAGCEEAGVPYLRLPVVVSSRAVRERLCELSRRRGLGVGPMYPTSIGEIPELRGQLGGRTFEAARGLADRLLTLPTHFLVPAGTRRALREFVRGHRILGAGFGAPQAGHDDLLPRPRHSNASTPLGAPSGG
jgi:dTDP-4-amino-4,6-dideoxygalactose transaminase